MTEDRPKHDPYDLERLAQDLEEREAHTKGIDDGLGSSSLDLPELLPLSYDNPYLNAEPFDVDAFLLSRSYTSLPDLRTELRDYLAKLKEELVQLINDDYEAFLSLSTNLRGEGARLERMRWPLESVRNHVVTIKDQLQIIKDDVNDKLEKRAAIREEKAFLHQLLKISDSVTRLESLLLISEPEVSPTFTGADTPTLGKHAAEIAQQHGDSRIKGNRAKHLVRIATEFTQLQYLAEKSRPSRFVDGTQSRIDRIKSTLSSDLEHLFSTTVQSLTVMQKSDNDGIRQGDTERGKLMADLLDCLSTYDMLSLWRDAEDVLRRDVVRPFIKKTIYPGCLSGPHSPLLPHTPFPNATFSGSSGSTGNPKTPYTPFTAFQSMLSPQYVGSSADAGSIYLLDDVDSPLAGLYNNILRFVDRDLRAIMECAERFQDKRRKASIDSKLGQSTILNLKVDDEVGDGDGFNILANAVWSELAQAIMSDLGSVVFAAGNPDEFRRNYTTTQDFLRSLEYLSPSMAAVRKMKKHPANDAFERRWQLPIYFQLRWKDIVSKVESALEDKTITDNTTKESSPVDESGVFKLKQTTAIWKAVYQCWNDDVYLPDIGHRFWKLTLQLLSRYRTWLNGAIPSSDQPNTNAIGADRSSTTSRTGTPVPSQEPPNSDRDAADEATLRQSALVLQDAAELERKVRSLWNERISNLLPEPTGAEESALNPEAILEQSIQPLTNLLSPILSQIVVILTRRCCDALAPVKSLPGQFRATSSKNLPAKPSQFVPLILRPAKTFFGVAGGEGVGNALKDSQSAQIASDVVEAVAGRYITQLAAMRKTEESLRRLKTGKKTGFAFFSGPIANTDDDTRVDERVRRQLLLDVEAFEKDAESLGVNVHESSAFKTLNYMVHTTATDADGS